MDTQREGGGFNNNKNSELLWARVHWGTRSPTASVIIPIL